jgi:hypothetical protein
MAIAQFGGDRNNTLTLVVTEGYKGVNKALSVFCIG